MKKFCFLLALTLLSCGRTPVSLTLMTYNVGVFSKYEDNSTAGVADVIRSEGADIVALNELDSCNRRHATFQLKDLSSQLGGWPFLFASAFPFAGGGYGNGVVSADEILNSFRVALPKGEGSEPRSIAVVETARCVLGAVHLDYVNEEATLEQMRVANEWFLEHYKDCPKPVFLCGDFNAKPDNPTMEYLRKYWDIVSPYDLSFPSVKPDRCIDYIMVLKGSCRHRVVGRAGVRSKFKFGDPATASDHLPVVVKLRIHQ